MVVLTATFLRKPPIEVFYKVEKAALNKFSFLNATVHLIKIPESNKAGVQSALLTCTLTYYIKDKKGIYTFDKQVTLK